MQQLENNATDVFVGSPNEAKPKSRRTLFIIVIAIAAVGLVMSAFLASALLSNPTSQDAWLFDGAYAKYQGETEIMGFDFGFSLKLEVLDLNSTHMCMSTSFRMGSGLGEVAEEENTLWVPLSSVAFIEALGESNATNSYDSKLDFGSLGTRSCTVYEIATEGSTITVYVDKKIGWPLKMTVLMIGEDSLSLSLDINLVDTNIPGLQSQ